MTRRARAADSRVRDLPYCIIEGLYQHIFEFGLFLMFLCPICLLIVQSSNGAPGDESNGPSSATFPSFAHLYMCLVRPPRARAAGGERGRRRPVQPILKSRTTTLPRATKPDTHRDTLSTSWATGDPLDGTVVREVTIEFLGEGAGKGISQWQRPW